MMNARESKGPLLTALLQLATVWVVFAFAEIAGGAAFIQKDIFAFKEFSPLTRATLVCANLSWLAVTVVLVGAPLAALVFVWRCDKTPRAARVLARLAFIVAVPACLSFYVGSWALYSGIGHFLNLDLLPLWMANPTVVIEYAVYMEPRRLTVTLLAGAAACAIVPLLLLKIVDWTSPKKARRPLIQVAAIIVVCLGAAVIGTVRNAPLQRPHEHPLSKVRAPYGEIYTLARDDHTGHFSHVAAALLQHFRPAETIETSGSLALDRKPIVSIEQYAETIDRSRLKPWNVIVILVESLRWDQVVACGGPRVVMPAVEELASQGRAYGNCYAQATVSDEAQMCPFSSHYPLRGEYKEPYPVVIPYPRVMIYDILKAVGYQVALFSSQNEYWQGMFHYLNTDSVDLFQHGENHDGSTYVMGSDFGFADWVVGKNRAGNVDDRHTVAKAIEWIGTQGDEPFFLGMNLQNSHVPYHTPDDFPRRFGPEKVDFPIAFSRFPPDKADVVKELYSNSLAYVDMQIGFLFEAVKERGLWDSTVIVVTGDHGQAFYEHGFASHGGEIYEEAMRVPLVIYAPGLQAGTDDGLAQHVDVPPSICDLVGLPTHPSFQGRSLFSGPPRDDHVAYLLTQTGLSFQYGLVRHNHKLIYDRRWRRHLLYDLSQDPDERNDISRERPELLRELGERLEIWRAAQIGYYADPKRTKTEYPPVVPD